MEQVEHNNLSLGTVANRCMANPKTSTILIILINTNKFNVWVSQPLLVAKLYDAECDQIEYRARMVQVSNKITNWVATSTSKFS